MGISSSGPKTAGFSDGGNGNSFKGFSKVPKASEFRAWAKDKGYELLKHERGVETWGIKGDEGGWRLKLKEPSQYENIHPDSKKFRFSARSESGVYYDSTTGKAGTKTEYGHMDMDPN